MNHIHYSFLRLCMVALVLCCADSAIAGCYPTLAAQIVAETIRGGGTFSEAFREAQHRGNVDSQVCVRRVFGVMRQYSGSYRDVLDAIDDKRRW